MKRILLYLALALILFLAYASKPDDKTCIIAAVERVWGDKTPDKEKYPAYFNQFMDVTSKDVTINDWVFLKRIQYKYGQDKKTIGIGAFKRVYTF